MKQDADAAAHADDASLPTRERELKPGMGGRISIDGRSLPTRERELKQGDACRVEVLLWSLPTRERELKRCQGKR